MNKKFLIISDEMEQKGEYNLILPKNYKIIFFNKPDKKTNKQIIKIILNQLPEKINNLTNLFIINCPIGRNETKINLENSLIIDYIKWIFKNNSSKLLKEIKKIFNEEIIINDFDKLNNYLKNQNYQKVKERLNFEILLFDDNTYIPELEFKIIHMNELNKSLLVPCEIPVKKILIKNFEEKIPNGVIIILNKDTKKNSKKYEIKYN